MKHIILIGFMGAGKSTMGKLIANKLGCRFIDTDTYIEKKEGRSIQDIFTDDGEDYFRSAETEVLRELLKADEKYVLALGGGTPLLEENRELLKASDAYVIFLKISAKDAYERLKDDVSRPLLQGTNVKEKIESLLQMRNPVYETIADYVLLEDNKTLDDIFYELSGVIKNK